MRVVLYLLVAGLSLSMLSCRAGKGCPTNGKNVGAEKLLSGDPKSVKAARKAGKFKS